jgi:hypothetical protein
MARPDDPIDYGAFVVQPSETFPQFLRRMFPGLAEVMYDEPTTSRDFELFCLGIQYAFARETYDRQTFVVRQTPQQIIKDFLAGLDFDRGRTETWFPEPAEADSFLADDSEPADDDFDRWRDELNGDMSEPLGDDFSIDDEQHPAGPDDDAS